MQGKRGQGGPANNMDRDRAPGSGRTCLATTPRRLFSRCRSFASTRDALRGFGAAADGAQPPPCYARRHPSDLRGETVTRTTVLRPLVGAVHSSRTFRWPSEVVDGGRAALPRGWHQLRPSPSAVAQHAFPCSEFASMFEHGGGRRWWRVPSAKRRSADSGPESRLSCRLAA
jgi:hypothetical protein